ncbi:hypothetical protein [Caballeronia mineralivorans]|uniref:hypothetical protein n=1 Tax=Caballeronia mineralivorans TaxID=2010198 RepID=UPI002AFE5DFC|nr:hypothetical protein [Caballeronia mineralivorans]
MSEIAGKTAGVAGTSPTGSEAERDMGTIAAAMRAAVELLAGEWPDEYPAGAMEWLIAVKQDGLPPFAIEGNAFALRRPESATKGAA